MPKASRAGFCVWGVTVTVETVGVGDFCPLSKNKEIEVVLPTHSFRVI